MSIYWGGPPISATLLGVGRRGGCSSHIFYTCPLERLASAHWFFSVFRFFWNTPWTFGKNLRNPICYWGFPFLFSVFDMFLGAVWSYGQILSHCTYLTRELLSLSFRMIFSAVSDFVIRFLISTRSSVGGLFRIFLVPKDSLLSWGSKIIGVAAPRLQAMSWEVFSLTACIFFKQQRRYLGIYSIISDGLTLVDFFPLHYI